MKMKLIASLLVLCLTFSVGSALAQNNNTNATNASTTLYPAGLILINGNVTGTVTLEGQTHNYTGPMLIMRDTSSYKEHIILLKPIIGSTGSTTLNTDTLTPLQVNKAESKTNMTFAKSTGSFGLILARDFKCQMTAKTINEAPAKLDLFADAISLFGPVNDVDKLFNTVPNPQISMTEVNTMIL
jgi:hypothetical protein